MANDVDTSLLQRAAEGDRTALAELFDRHRDRLRRLVRLRLHRALRGEIDEAYVLREALVEAARRLRQEPPAQPTSVFLWLRQTTAAALNRIHRRQLGDQAYPGEGSVSLYDGALPVANSAALAAQLLGNQIDLSPTAIKAEARVLIQQALNAMAPIDRETLTLRHFEQLTLAETAEVMGLTASIAGKSYLRALKRMRALMSQLRGPQPN